MAIAFNLIGVLILVTLVALGVIKFAETLKPNSKRKR